MAENMKANEEAPVTEKVTTDMLRFAYREAISKNNEKTEEVTTEPEKKSVEGSKEISQEQKPAEVQLDTQSPEEKSVVDEVVVPTATEPTEAKKPVDNSESSRLGRKLAKLETDRQKDSETLNAILQRLDKLSNGEVQEAEDGVPEVITTPEDVYRVIDIKAKKEKEAMEQYQYNYAETVDTYEALNSDLHVDIINEMLTNPKFNMVITGNPSVDAKVNYADAKSAILAKKLAQKEPKKNPVKGEPPIAAIGLSGTSKVTAPKPETPKLDDLSLRFLAKTGKSEEWASKVLSENQ